MLFKNINHLERINKINKLIKEQKTGTPETFAKSISIRERQLYNILDNFRTIGASIKYCRKRETYYYDDGFDLQIKFSVEIIKKEKLTKIYGGSKDLEHILLRNESVLKSIKFLH